jgi:aminomethyltransferase
MATVAEPLDYTALRHGCGLADRSSMGRLAMTGADRQRFLNAQVTCDIKGLEPGEGAYGFFTNHQGKILADVVVLVLEDRLWLELPPGRADEIAAHLRKYIIVDRVEVEPLDSVPLTLLGPGAAAVLRTLTPELPESPWSHLPAEGLGEGVVLARRDGLGVPAWTLWTPDALAPEVSGRLLAAASGEKYPPRPVSAAALETVRAEAGIPLYGQDFGGAAGDNFPQESGLEEQAVSYTKGCYLGQEVVARIHFRGGVHKGLCGLLFPAGEPAPPLGAKLRLEEKEVGKLTTVVESPALGRPIGLAVLNKKAAEPGTALEVVPEGGEGSGGRAEVTPLPFVSA